MSGLLTWAASQAGPMLVTYISGKVVGRLTEKWWGRGLVAVLKIVNSRGTKTADADLRERLEKVEKLNAEQLAKLDADEQALVNHETTPQGAD